MTSDSEHATPLFSTEQNELRNLLRRVFTDTCSGEYLRRRMRESSSSDPQFWEELRTLGLFDLFDPEDGGLGMHELAMIAYECGRALVPEQITEALYAGAVLFRLASLPSSATELVRERSEILRGSKLVALVPASVRTCEADHVKLSGDSAHGSFSFVRGADRADYLMSALPAEGGKERAIVVALRRGGVTLVPVENPDQTQRLFQVECNGAPCAVIEEVDHVRWHGGEQVLATAQMAGACERAFEMTLEYAKTRTQFDLPIGAFQVVQHRLAEMHLGVESMRALTNFAAWSLDRSPEQSVLASQAATAYVGEEGPKLVESAIQIHGGIGFTWEYDLHLFLRRVRTLEALFRPTVSDREALFAAAATA